MSKEREILFSIAKNIFASYGIYYSYAECPSCRATSNFAHIGSDGMQHILQCSCGCDFIINEKAEARVR